MSPQCHLNFSHAFSALKSCFETPIETDRDIAGTIQSFEFAFEASWKALRVKLDLEGIGANTPREVFSKAFQSKWIQDEKLCLEMIKDRNLTVHTYNRSFAEQMIKKIETQYIGLFDAIETVLSK